jgi:multicomponent Na+:H+ antiporter subunit D
VLGSADELLLRGRGRALPVAAAAFAVGGLVVAGLPPFAGWLGVSLIGEAATSSGETWVRLVADVASAVAAAAILRAGLRIFAGAGPSTDPLLTREEDEPEREEPGAGRPHRSPAMIGSLAALLVLTLGLGFAPRLAAHAEQAAQLLQDRRAYVETVLGGGRSHVSAVTAPSVPFSSYVEGLLGVVAAIALATAALAHERVHSRWLSRVAAGLGPAVERLRLLHSGRIGDYVAWTTVGTAVLGVALVAVTR